MEELADYDFWVADYTGKVGWTGPYGMWQYSGSGAAPGITTAVDLDYAYKDYPALIQAAGLNGYGKDKGTGDDPAKEGASDDIQKELDALRAENDELHAEIAVLKMEKSALNAKIAAVQKALE